MKILITGNKGFVGSETQRLLEANGHEVVGFDLMEKNDIRDLVQFENAIIAENPDRILHLAAIARFDEADRNVLIANETNTAGTMNVARIAGKYHIPVVYSSTGSVYMPILEEPPITENFRAVGNSTYACSKFQGEEYIRKYAHPWIILRYSHLFGAEKRYHGLIGGFLARIEKGAKPSLYGGKQSNDFLYVKDVARANLLALEAPWDKWGQVYNIGTGKELSAEEAGKIVCEVFGYKGKVDKHAQRTVDPNRFVFDTSKADKMLGFRAQWKFKDALIDMKKEMDRKSIDNLLDDKK